MTKGGWACPRAYREALIVLFIGIYIGKGPLRSEGEPLHINVSCRHSIPARRCVFRLASTCIAHDKPVLARGIERRNSCLAEFNQCQPIRRLIGEATF
jgi:hypothetical protein